MRGVVVTLLLIGGCGRSGFDLEPDAGVVMNGDGAPSGSVMRRFGEKPTSDVTGVTADTYLDSEVPQNAYNYGMATGLSAESSQKHALVKFTLTAIPPGKTISSAQLLIYSQSSYGGGGAVYPVLEDWTEGTGTGTTGTANWTMRTATLAWATAGAGTPGSSGAQVATFTTPGTGAFAIDLPVSLVQRWIDTPASNFGLMLSASGGNDLSFASSNSTTGTNRPELVVTYTP